ncbi:hypothetical protein TNCV_4513401 [Trichonephila clavipes]|nr:hypothetical protein TNCV_4513401 [Trichonephila clavipes]
MLPTARRRMQVYSPKFGAGVDRQALTSPSIIHGQFFELFVARRSNVLKHASLCICSAARELLLRDKKILLLEGRYTSLVQTL